MEIVTPRKSSSMSSETCLDIPPGFINALQTRPEAPIDGVLNGVKYTVHVITPYYEDIIRSYYKDELDHDLLYYYDALNIPRLFRHFGVCIQFEQPTELLMHNRDMSLLGSAKELIKPFGVVIIKNAYMAGSIMDMGHRNRFPQLNFHIDRNINQETRYSLYTRNPFDEEQKAPRTSSTLFIPSLAAYLQSVREGKPDCLLKNGLITHGVIFNEGNIKSVLGNVVAQHAWNEPFGCGEMSMIDNANILHASYYPNPQNKGYRIGVRYVS